jgi:hypothetical protein
MSHHPFRNIGRCLLAAGAFSIGVVSLGAQTPAATPGVNNPSRIDVFMGYSYFGAHGVVKPANVPFSSDNEGAAFSVAYYLNKYVGGEVLGFANPDGTNDGLYAGYAGPIFRAPMQNFTLFAHGLAGRTRLRADILTLGALAWLPVVVWITTFRSSITSSVSASSRLITATFTWTMVPRSSRLRFRPPVAARTSALLS